MHTSATCRCGGGRARAPGVVAQPLAAATPPARHAPCGGVLRAAPLAPPLSQSAFIIGYSGASLAMGAAVRAAPPFKLMAGGLAVWVLASFAAAAAPSFAALLVARMASGVGEASFQCVVPPWIDDNAPPARRALWLSLFYLNIPVGTALGYALGGLLSAHVGWRWMFIFEAVRGRAARATRQARGPSRHRRSRGRETSGSKCL